MVGNAVQQALDPLTSAIKRATAKRPEKAAEPTAAPTAAPGKPGLAVSPLAVPLPEDAAHRRRADRHRPGRLLQA
jgi:glutamate N-acetyltransferase/amino-acid N-acetyltransferase